MLNLNVTIMMKVRSIAYVAVLFAVTLFTSCGGDDDEAVVIPPTQSSDDGLFITGDAAAATPESNYKLEDGYVDNPVDGDDATPTTERSNMYEGYYYLGAGSINFTQVIDGVETVWGGTESTGDQDGYVYRVGDLSEGGAAVVIADAGLYHVVVDIPTSSFYVNKIDAWNIIGPAGEGWSTDIPLAQKSMENGTVVFEATNVTMSVDEFKFRYNSNWVLDRKTSTPGDDELVIHTNLGGPGARGVDPKPNEQIGSFVPGGVNFVFAGEGRAKYTATLTFAPGEGRGDISVNFTKTGEADAVTFDPGEYNWAVTGSATVNGWASDVVMDHDFEYKGEDGGTHTWVRSTRLAADSAWKIRANDAWDVQLNGGNVTLTGTCAGLFDGSDNINVNASADQFYVMTVTTSDEGATWTLQMDSCNWGAIGDATPGGWDNSTPLTYDGGDSWSATITFADPGEFKFRANDAWDFNIGGELTALVRDGGNLATPGAGDFTVTLTSSDGGDTYSATVQ